MSSDTDFDCFQFFEVKHNPGCIIRVTVLEARGVSKGWIGDLVDTPDPYVILRIDGAATPEVSTVAFENNIHPVWNETFEFFTEGNKDHTLEVILMDENYTTNELIGQEKYPLTAGNMPCRKVTLKLNYGCELDLEVEAKISTETDLRYSLGLCAEEKQYRLKRKNKVFENMKSMFGDKGPKNIREVPTIGVLGSGGGFRAMVGMGGAIGALTDSNLLDLVMYTGVLSGSSWYLSQLYSNERWPKESAGALQEELKANIKQSQLWMHTPTRIYKYLNDVLEKKHRGQPVSFTDLFGHLIAETLINNRKQYKLTDMQSKIEDGTQPFPLFSCLHVKRNVSALTFHEWVEFSPYEIGMAKYGTFLRSAQFGSGFFMGKIIKTFPEPPLHYLLGLWGSAFTILLTRIFSNQKKDPIQIMRADDKGAVDTSGDGKEEDFKDGEDDSSSDSDAYLDALEEESEEDVESDEDEFYLAEQDVSDEDTFKVDRPLKRNSRLRSAIKEGSSASTVDTPISQSPSTGGGSQRHCRRSRSRNNNSTCEKSNQSGTIIEEDTNVGNQSAGCIKHRSRSTRSFRGRSIRESQTDDSKLRKSIKRRSLRRSLRRTLEDVSINDHMECEITRDQLVSFKRKSIKKIREIEKADKDGYGSDNETSSGVNKTEKLPENENASHGESFLAWALQTFLHSTGLLYKRFGRAAKIHNFMRGLCISEVYPFSPLADTTISPMATSNEVPFTEIFEKQPTEPKTLYLVDAGLTFNSPYPLLLRPQRGVEIYLSFDFSRRPTDNTPPFKELVLASKWARLNKVPFPRIDQKIIEREGWKECYVFKDETDPTCPVVLHFPLVNINFKRFKAPGVPRETKEEKEFGDFTIFDDPKDPYSTYNFSYKPYTFDRLNQLVTFNTLLKVELIKREIIACIEKKRKFNPGAIDLGQIMNLRSKLRKIRGNMAPTLFKNE